MEKIFLTRNSNPCLKQKCLIRHNGQMYLKDQAPNMWCLHQNIMKDIVYGTARKQTATGSVHGMP